MTGDLLTNDDAEPRRLPTRAYSRRQIVRSVTAGGAVMLGMASLAAVPAMARCQAQSMGGRLPEDAIV